MTEFDDVIRLLREGRPQATEVELDQIKQRVRRRAAEPSRRNQSMKSRLAILAMLVTGMLFSTAGAGLAVSGIASNGTNASVSQYGTPATTPEGGVLPAEETSTPSPKPTAAPTNAPEGGVLPAEETQPSRQVSATSGSQLPFTGFAAIPVMLGGIALLTGGLVLRRRTRAE
jgi:hypothetical protein